jgi:phytanoyl-CoA hydroxylase
MPEPVPQLSSGQRDAYDRDGFVRVPAVFNHQEIVALRQHFLDLRARGPHPGDYSGADASAADPLRSFPRMIDMHDWDATSREWLLDPRLIGRVGALFGHAAYAVQTMLYFKPPGARGQALHQDQFYLRARPGTCMGAWLALDRADEENGCLLTVPGLKGLDLLCTEKADTRISFTDVGVPVPDGLQAVPQIMEAGDVLFFDGSVIHGSLPNRSANRFRMALIGHYIDGIAQEVAAHYHPVLRADGSVAPLAVAPEGGPCGIWVDQDGQPAVAMTGTESRTGALRE